MIEAKDGFLVKIAASDANFTQIKTFSFKYRQPDFV